MSISFEDSLKAAQTQNVSSEDPSVVAPMSSEENSVATLESTNYTPLTADETTDAIAAYDGWMKPANASLYTYYDNEYYDNKYSTVDINKNIFLNTSQVNLTQEKNSQYIPFEIPRYYDGFDLTETQIAVYWVNEFGNGGLALPADVYYNSEKIRFAWLIDDDVTAFKGKLQFEIQASGTNSQGFGYLWKTKPNSELNVLQALEIKSFIEPDESWQENFILRLSEQANKSEAALLKATAAATTAENAAKQAQDIRDELLDGIDAEVQASISDKLDNYYTKPEVDTIIDDIDVSDQLKDYALISDVYNKTDTDAKVNAALENYTTKDEVAEAISKADISDKLNDYVKTNDLETNYYNKADVDSALQNISLEGYATEKFVTDRTDVLSADVNTNKGSISALSNKVEELDEIVNSVDTAPRLTYDVAYNDIEDPDVGENVFVFYEIADEGGENEEKTPKQKFTIVGGGGNTTSSTLKIGYVTTSPLVVTVDDRALITYTFSGTDSSGDAVAEGMATWKVNGKVVATNTAFGITKDEDGNVIAQQGENTFDITDYISIGEQKVNLTITDDAGSLSTKNWTVQVVDVKIQSDFNDHFTYPIGPVSFDYVAYGSISKDIHFILDGTEIGTVKTSSSGIPTSYELPAQEHGSHLLEVYMTATINGNKIESNHIFKDIIWFDESRNIPVISTVYQKFNARQYDTTNIEYTVYDPSTETPDVEIAVDGITVATLTLTENTAVYPFKTDIVGEHIITITCGETVKTLIANIAKLDIDVSPVTAGLAFDFNPVGYSNNSIDRLWSYNDVAMTVSDNFDWVNGGYQIDENGDQYFCVKAGTNAVINYNLFADDPKKTGKEFKVIFKTKNIRKRDTSFLTCLDGGIGLDMKVEHATVYDSGGSLKSNYCEDAIIEYEFNINKDTNMMIVMSYEDGTPSKPYEYTATSSFKQTSPQPIVIGSADCDIFIYRMKAYSLSLTDADIKNNFIADARNATEMIARYERNQIYNDNNALVSTSASGDFSADALMKAAPDLRYIFLEVPQFTNDKDNKIDGCNVYFRYPAGTRPHDNWDCTGVRHRGQGTSSNLYGYAGRNIDLCMDRDESLFTYTDEEGNIVESSTITLTDTSVPTDYLNIKVNIASSENANNAEMARRFNEYQPFLRYARKKNSKVKDTMEFYNCVVFIRETSTDASVPHREFNDTNWHFYGIGNVGDSKKTDDTRVNNKRDPKEHVIEITDADKPLSAFPTGKDGHAVCPVAEWKTGNSAYDVLYSNDYIYDEEGAFESFGGKTYEFRYEMKDITDEQRQVNIDTWRDLYTFIVTSTDEEFYANLKNYFVVDSALYYYLFTERYTMVDNRAKNSFWHYGKVYISNEEATALGETEASYYIIDDEMAAINDGYRYDLTFGYDFDTCLGIDNTGDYVFSYGKEDTDYYVDGDPTSDYVFRVADSVFFCRLRDLFPSELQAMFKDREDKNAWNANSLISQWDNSQAKFPEELWRLDYERKYYRTYLGLSIDNSINVGEGRGVDKTFLIGKFFGRKKYARRAFEINNEVYFATKYFGNRALSDVFWIRGNVPIGGSIKPNYSLTLVPYSDMYVCVQYTSTGTPIHKKVKAGQTCVFESDAERMDFIYVYAASFIQEVGDLSRCFVGDNNFSSAIRLQKLTIGSADDGYENTFMKEVLVANNPLLEYLDLRNISGIDTVIDVSGCSNLKELYAEGTNASGVIFANGGLLEIAHLPRIKSLSMKNLYYINDFTVDNYDNLETLIVENTPSVNTYNIINEAPRLLRTRLINLIWDDSYHISDASIFNRLLALGGIDSSGYESDISVLTGSAHVAVIKERENYNCKQAWPDLNITANTIIEQFAVTFVNDDDSVLEIQYVDKGSYAIDPTQREDSPLPIPTKESTISTDYIFDGWDTDLSAVQIFGTRIVKAQYKEAVRQYQIKYVAKGTTLPGYPKTGNYGENIPYEGPTPTYTLEESGYKYYLFNRWDKSGFLNGDFDEDGVKTVTAIFDEFAYTGNDVFAGRELKDLSPVEIYALTKLTEPIDKELADFGMEVETGDDFNFVMGYDIDFDDISSEEIITQKTIYNGTNYYDTGIKLFDEDKDFVLALDYNISSDNASGATLMQCFQSSGSNGFKLNYTTSPQFVWGSTSSTPASADNREMIVVRHKKGDNNLYVYNSNLSGDGLTAIVIDKTTVTQSDTATLVLGAAKQDSGRFTNYAIGEINWCKIWYEDLGEDICKKLVGWTHEEIRLEVSGFYRYQLYDDNTKETMMSLLATHLLANKRQYNTSSTSAGGWASCALNSFLNNRFYEAIPDRIKGLLKKMSVSSTIGQMSTEISSSGCYVAVPAPADLDVDYTGTYRSEVYDTNGNIRYMVNDDDRKRAFIDGDYSVYWTRSPDIRYASYIHNVTETGNVYSFVGANSKLGVLIEISF